MESQLSEFMRDNLPIASMGQSQTTFIQFRLASARLTHRIALKICSSRNQLEYTHLVNI